MPSVLSRTAAAIAVAVLVVIGAAAPAAADETPAALGAGSATLAQGSASPKASPRVVTAAVTGFDPGNIIDDAVFFASGTMSVAEIQSFLNARVPSCDPGYTCLKDYAQATSSRAADAMCRSYTGKPRETSAEIIYNVAQACGINPQVILVTLQKEQSLVTDTYPYDSQYKIAMGQGCPDTAACDSRYFGFFNQVYGAAWQLKRYANPPGTQQYFTWYAPGRTWNIRYHPEVSCGSSPVYVQNQATANLYYYTPYQPNRASLAAGYGQGDGCSSYGNRNFHNYFTAWFGSTKSLGPAAIAAKYAAVGGAAGALGGALNAPTCGLPENGCYQVFANGQIHWSAGYGAFVTTGAMLSRWAATGYERGSLGYPISDQGCGLPGEGCYQVFQKGKIHWSAATGAFSTGGGIGSAWARNGNERGALGYPVTEETCGLTGGGCYQRFQNGQIHWAPGVGAFATRGDFLATWASTGYEKGALGYPLNDQTCGLVQEGCYQTFQHGGIHWTAATGAHSTHGGIGSEWARTGYERGALGFPVAEETCGLAAGACSQQFQSGRIVWVPGIGSRVLTGDILTAWDAQGGGAGPTGYPLSGQSCALIGGGCFQVFQNGQIHWSTATGAHWTHGGIGSAWAHAGYEGGPLGYPAGAESCSTAGDVCTQRFQRGQVTWTAGVGTAITLD
ncbi:hypothetical protein NQ156_11815 [Microbacterium sp. zg.Y625]|uniref:LGFP repeat-containing protein n=1 Tax=Microbacterium jiangjiandongii TaxID=3049071 RepID=UPI00214B1124|nr:MULTISPECIES: hypothetical protein [unclassified Microbacterium]MCR2793751.1 hypothetical protein [Microbacterium sp. zg.Y625]WIM26095.1 hypothetical protein QNO14_03295 [Microbacterium sp. zg-Y625]